MEWWVIILATLAWGITNVRGQQRRVRWLGGHLRTLQLEQLMETLADGYLRAVGEPNASRGEQVWSLLAESERKLCDQVQLLAQHVAAEPAPLTRFSRMPMSLPPALLELFPWTAADVRGLLRIHADGIVRVATNAEGLSRRDRAFMLTAEMLLFQHSCHWFCRSRNVAHARSMARHKTPHAQLVDSASATTREAYQRWLRLA